MKITKDVIRAYFGEGAKVWGFGGHFRVTTRTGGEVVIGPNQIKVILGGDDVHRACTLLARDKWGGATVRGSREFMLGAVAHGEAWGVNIRADHSEPGAAFLRGLVFVGVVVVGLMMGGGQDATGMVVTLCVAAVVWWAMKQSAKREEQRKREQMGFHYPRVDGTAGAASHDHAKREGWV